MSRVPYPNQRRRQLLTWISKVNRIYRNSVQPGYALGLETKNAMPQRLHPKNEAHDQEIASNVTMRLKLRAEIGPISYLLPAAKEALHGRR